MDIITTLPETIIENILCLLPIEEAARSSIISREWRYKWTKIPKLVFFQSMVKRPTEKKHLSYGERASRAKDMRCKLFYAIHQVLLLHQGPIHEFTLSMDVADGTCFEIDQIILHLSRNYALKKLTLNFDDPGFNRPYRLPLSVFSLHHLTDLYLEYCNVNLKPVFSGLGSLTSLTLNQVLISSETILHLLSNCPSLKSLRLMLTLVDDERVRKAPCIMKLSKCLPVIERLTVGSHAIILFVLGWGPKELPTSLLHLKYLCIGRRGLGDECGLTFLGVLMKCSPNLEKIKIEIETGADYDELGSLLLDKYSNILEKNYSDVWLEHLIELEIEIHFNKPELEFVKFILARSPNLKKMILGYASFEELEVLRNLLRPPHASQVEFISE